MLAVDMFTFFKFLIVRILAVDMLLFENKYFSMLKGIFNREFKNHLRNLSD